MPFMFPQQQPASGEVLGPQQLVKFLYASPDTKYSLPTGFMSGLIARFENDGLEELFGPVLDYIHSSILKMNIDDSFVQTNFSYV